MRRQALTIFGIFLCSCQGGKYLDHYEVEAPTSEAAFHLPEQMTAGTESNFSPDLSPNGAFVLYTSDRKGNKDIWEKRTSGGFARPLTTHAADDFSPVLSPDASHIAFVSRREDAAGDIHILELGFSLGSSFGMEGESRAISQKQTEDTNPAWYPKSDKIVFSARSPGEKLPRLMVADLKDLKPQPLGEALGEQPSVSPDGKMIAFVREGAVYIYHEGGEKIDQITAGGLLRDGQPKFTEDGKRLLFIRYADDTNGDGKLDGNDRPSIWMVDLSKQRAKARHENFELTPLSAATFAAFSPQIRSPFLYFTLQTHEGLNIFRLPETGQMDPANSLDDLKHYFDQFDDHYRKVYVLRRAQAYFCALGREDDCVEAAIMELEWQVQNQRVVEAQWIYRKIKENFAKFPALNALADLAVVQLELTPVQYPTLTAELTENQKASLLDLRKRTEAAASQFSGDDGPSKRVRGKAQLIKSKILASERRFFEANELLTDLPKTYSDQKNLAAEAAYYAALITPATSDVETSIINLRRVAEKYPDNQNIVKLSSAAAINFAESRQNPLEALVTLRNEAKGLPTMPALAHMRVSEHFMKQGKVAVAANELRQIVDLYPESPDVLLEAAKRLSALEEKASRYEAAETMLMNLRRNVASSGRAYRRKADALLIAFLLRRGENLMKEGESALAIKEYRRVVELGPLNINAHRGLIEAAYRRGNLEALLEEYKEKKDSEPHNAKWMYFYGYALTYGIDEAKGLWSRLGVINDCIGVVEAARALDSQILQIHQTLGWLYLQKGYWQRRYQDSGAVLGKLSQKTGMVKNFFGFGEPNWLELAIDEFQTAYYLSEDGSLEQAGLAQNLGHTFYELKNYVKSLSYYMQRIKMISLIPMRDAKAEGVLLRHAGRAAFNSDELELAESLQRKALAAWERANVEMDVAYSLDALALTLRERSRYKEALTFYERLLHLNQRLELTENVIGTYSNLGYVTYMEGRIQDALGYFEKAEEQLASLAKEGEGNSKAKSESIQVDLGGEGSAAKGFDLFARQNLIVTFKAKVYERLERYDLALATLERKLELLRARREALIDDGKSEKTLAEEIAIAENNVAELRLKTGEHLGAKLAYRSASDFARILRPESQKHMSRGEWLNTVNHGRVQLRLAALGLVDKKEVAASVNELDKAATDLRRAYLDGAAAEGKPLAEMQALKASLVAIHRAPTDEERLRASLEESLKIVRSLNLPSSYRHAALLTWQAKENAAAEGIQDPDLAKAIASFATEAGKSPDLDWKYQATQSNWEKSFEALERYIASGGALRSPNDRLAARLVFENHAKSRSNNANAFDLVMRRYLAMRHTDLALRSLNIPLDNDNRPNFPKVLRDLLQVKSPDEFSKVLGKQNSVLAAHKTLAGPIWVTLRDKQGVQFVEVSSKAYEVGGALNLLASPQVGSLLPAKDSWLYIVPSHEFYDAPWENIKVDGESLNQHFHISYIASADFLPTLASLKRLPKADVGHLPEIFSAPVNIDEDKQKSPPPVQAMENVRESVTKAKKDYHLITLGDSGQRLGQSFAAYDLLHIDLPFVLNEVEPRHSFQKADSKEGKGSVNDLTLTELAKTDLAETTAILFTNVQPKHQSMEGSGVASDGWISLQMATAAAHVPTVMLAERPKTSAGSPRLNLDWTSYYQALSDKPAAEAASFAPLSLRVLGYGGIPSEEEKEFAAAQLESTLEAAGEAYDEEEWDDAAKQYRRALYYAVRLDKQEDVSEVLRNLERTYVSRRDFGNALHYQLKIAASIKSPASGKQNYDAWEYGEAINKAAASAVRAQLFEKAESLLNEAEEVLKDEDAPALLGEVYRYRGINQENQKQYEATIGSYKKSREAYLEAGNAPQAATRLKDIGTIYFRSLSQYAKAIEYYDTAAAEFLKLKDRDSYISALLDKANALMAMGQLELAISTLEHQVVPDIDKSNQLILWVRATQSLTSAYFRAGLYQEAKDLNSKTLSEIKAIESQQSRVSLELDSLNSKALLLAKLGQQQESFQIFRAAIEQALEYKNKDKLALLYANYGVVVREAGRVDQSIEFFDKALAIDTELKSRSSVASDQRNIGFSAILKGDYNRARDLLTESLKTSDELNLLYNKANCHFGLGDMALRQSDWREAELQFQKALQTSEKAYMQDFTWRAEAGLAAAMMRQERSAEAEKLLRSAVVTIERLRAGLKSESSRNAFFSEIGVQEVYENFATVLMSFNKVEEAWQVSERARARSFIDTLGAQKLKFARTESDQLVVEEKQVKSDIETLERKLSQAEAAEKDSLSAAYTQALKKHSDVLHRIREVDFKLTQFVTIDPITKDELSKTLPPDTAVIQYLVTKDKLYAWLLHKGQITGHSVPVKDKDLQSRISDFRMLMQNYSTTDYIGAELAAMLLTPMSQQLEGVTRIAIVPHKSLHFLPFAALPYNKQFLIDRFSIYYLDAATVARFAPRDHKKFKLNSDASILALANPTTSRQRADLPFAEREVEAMSRYFEKIRPAFGPDATKDLVTHNADQFDVLHIASHGEFLPNTPGESRLFLAEGSSKNSDLLVNEVFSLKMKAKLVTLSACETGLGSISAGDEIIGLNRAFTYAGADTVVSSLWRISDVASAVTMKRFYRYLREGQDKAEAMRKAQLVVRRYFNHPAYWAAFRVQGDYL